MKKRSTLIALILALFTVILGLNSVQAAATTKTVINDKIWWLNDYGDKKFEDFKDFKHIGDVASNDWGITYFTPSGDLAWYSPKTGKTLVPLTQYGLKVIHVYGAFEPGDIAYARFVAGQNYLKGYDTLDKIKEAMNKPKGTTPVAPVVSKEPNNPAEPTKPAAPVEPKPAAGADTSEDVPAVHDIAYLRPEDRKEPTTAQKQGWVQDKGNWFYYDQQGRQKSGWVQVGGAWYYLASDGKMQTGWVNQGGVWYYLNGSGAMQTGWLNQSGTWYYLNGSGVMQTGWLSLSGTWYYLTASGSMKTGWYQVSTKWYYSYGSGALAVSTTVDGYYVNANGEWV